MTDQLLVFDLDNPTADPVGFSIRDPITFAFKENSRELLALGDDGLVHRMNLDPQETIELACATVGRNMDPLFEWEEHFTNEPYELICEDEMVPGGFPPPR